MTEKEIEEILEQHDVDHDQEITYEEFTAMILDHM